MNRRFAIIDEYKLDNINLPTRKTCKSAGYDIEAAETTKIMPGEIKLIPTGLKVYMEDDEVLTLHIRSSVAIKMGLALANGTGIIDADYVDNPENQGHIQFALHNFSSSTITINKGQAIAQGIFQKFLLTTDDMVSNKRLGGFGSTD